ncbi:MAG: aminodeoxychorismate synthase component I, partial [Shewanella sp.]
MVNRASKQLASRQLDWTLSTANLFEHFAAEPWAILLDSANAPHLDAKFDIICVNPIATLITHGELTDIHVQLPK